ncbi:hypothetical protein GWK90_04480 [Candidatus Hamiltonella defensa]|uniref:hypothetical protein n=1 Tax=Candidatus Williamhamiltonella TaxID=568987 RepID=UPI0012FDD773|nr:hypothetical protein [Candidatus Hamiltonella defensa]MBK4361547.1 hypothetical protein [Candidatus Hamiltonella defensa]
MKKCHIRADLEASAVSLAMLHIIGLAPSMKIFVMVIVKLAMNTQKYAFNLLVIIIK